MKALIKYLFLFSAVICFESFTIKDDTSKLYIIALTRHVLNIENNISSQNEKKEFNSKELFIINKCELELPEKINNHKVHEIADSSNDFILDTERLHVIKLNPISIDKGVINIVLSDYMANKNNGEVIFSYIGGKKYSFNYDFQKKNYKIIKMQIISF